MEKLIGWTKADAWGSTNAIPEFLGAAAGDDPVSEVWFGTHPDGPTLLTSGDTLAEHIAADPKRALGGRDDLRQVRQRRAEGVEQAAAQRALGGRRC